MSWETSAAREPRVSPGPALSDPTPRPSERRWRLFLDVLFVIAIVIAAAGGLIGSLSLGAFAIQLSALVAAVAIWLAGLRDRSRPRLAWLLAASALLFMSATDGPAGLLFTLVAVVVLTVECGVRNSTIAAMGASIYLGGLTWVQFHQVRSTPAIIGETLVLGLFLGFALLAGALLHDLERNRQVTLAANDRLRRSMSLERDLLLAEERARSARDLHDGLGSRLTLMAMSLDYARRMREQDPQRTWAEIDQAVEDNRAALDYMRAWVRALAPPALPPGVSGLAAVESLALPFRGTGLNVTVAHTGSDEALPEQAALLAQRVAQECLTNVLRYAQAESVTITLEQSHDHLRVAVRDDGVGAAVTNEGFGLRSLRERAEEFGGSMIIRTRPEDGFEVDVHMPLERFPRVPQARVEASLAAPSPKGD